MTRDCAVVTGAKFTTRLAIADVLTMLGFPFFLTPTMGARQSRRLWRE